MKKNIKNKLIRKDMDVSEYERLSNITLRHKLKLSAVLHFTILEGSTSDYNSYPKMSVKWCFKPAV